MSGLASSIAAFYFVLKLSHPLFVSIRVQITINDILCNPRFVSVSLVANSSAEQLEVDKAGVPGSSLFSELFGNNQDRGPFVGV
jgi:hypothetical protein